MCAKCNAPAGILFLLLTLFGVQRFTAASPIYQERPPEANEAPAYPVISPENAVSLKEVLRAPNFLIDDIILWFFADSFLNIEGGDFRFLHAYTGRIGIGALSVDGRYYASVIDKTTVIVWDMATGEELYVLDAHTRYAERTVRYEWQSPITRVTDIVFSPDGQSFITHADDGVIFKWDTATGVQLWAIEAYPTCYCTSVSFDYTRYSPNGETFFQGITVYDAETGQSLYTMPNTDIVQSAEYSPDGTHILMIAFISGSRTALLLNAVNGRQQARFAADTARYSPDGLTIVLSSWQRDPSVRDALTGELVWTLDGGDGANPVYSPDGHSLLSGGSDGIVRIWDVATGSQRDLLDTHSTPRIWDLDLEYSPDGRLILIKTGDGILYLCDAATGIELIRLQLSTMWSWASFSPDGRIIMVVSNDGITRLYAVPSD